MKRGSITVFAALCLLFTTSALLVLSEAARVWGLEQYVEWKGRQSVEYAAAEYQPYLWEQYHILSFDGGRGSTQFEAGTLTGEVMRAAESRNGRGTDLFGVELTHIYEPEYLLLTDQEGEIFISLVTSYMKQNLPNEVLESFYEKYQKAWDTQVENPEYEDVETSIENAENGLQEARKAAEAEERPVPAVAENPLETADSIRESMRDSLLVALLPEGAKLPTEQLPVEEALENRVLEGGNSYYESSYGVQERILAAQYAGSVFPCYGREDGEQAVTCALEYLVGGKATGQENLETAVKRLLLGRTAANVTVILSDPEKMEQVYVVTTALAGFAVDPFLHKAVKIAVVGAWAFLESVQDVRALLAGGKIALLKDRSEWTMELSGIGDAISGTRRAKECVNGWTYEEYLTQMLAGMDGRTLAYRMMDLMEWNLRRQEDCSDCRMDHMITAYSYRMQFEAVPLFSKMSLFSAKGKNAYYFETEKGISYIP